MRCSMNDSPDFVLVSTGIHPQRPGSVCKRFSAASSCDKGRSAALPSLLPGLPGILSLPVLHMPSTKSALKADTQ